MERPADHNRNSYSQYHTSHSLNSLKGVVQGIISGTTLGQLRGIPGVSTIAHIKDDMIYFVYCQKAGGG